MTVNEITTRLKSMANPENAAGMSKDGINPENTLGIPAPFLWKLVKEIGKNHDLAAQRWETGIREARIFSCVVEEPDKVTGDQLVSLRLHPFSGGKSGFSISTRGTFVTD